ncbi:putative 2-keto-3-deoxy-galactonate aldolase YagE [Rubripirellula amarantea]|uniref:Putative 2-keto-3-deoxy-galactonate aldolase YagE n=1 Tax=Rubripirellula amarantea TaxID=2527999 RepID=A0A5C5WUY0_9BACT|nr:dihydrodipicolinate synthase family protein [Rubripirellula amarantea]TWT54370.1 putative 2-keto-3-deoxy-galactonate aldolase YagE [Rubripirellula amarantea]
MQKLHGIIPPLVTPLLEDDIIDVAGTERLIEHVIAGGVHGIFILGTTGEAPSLSHRLRREFIELVCRQVGGRVCVLVGVTDPSYVETMHLSRAAADAGADATVLTTPYYFPAGQTELRRYVDHVCESMPLPMMVYNIPSLTKVRFELETLNQLADNDRIIGVKDSSGDFDYFEQLITLKTKRPDWSIFIGPEHLLTRAIAVGGDGGVNGGANIFPSLFTKLYQAAIENDEARRDELQLQVERLQLIYDVGKYASRHIKATKSALSIRGICSDVLAEPFNHFLEPERTIVAAIIASIEN